MLARYWDLPCPLGYQQPDTHAISSWHPLPLFPSASAQLAPPYTEDRWDFLVDSCKTSEHWASVSEGQAHREMPAAFTYTNISPAFTVCKNKGQGLRTWSCGQPSGGRPAEPKVQEGTGRTGNFQVVHLGFPGKGLRGVTASPIWKEPQRSAGLRLARARLQQPVEGLPTSPWEDPSTYQES